MFVQQSCSNSHNHEKNDKKQITKIETNNVRHIESEMEKSQQQLFLQQQQQQQQQQHPTDEELMMLDLNEISRFYSTKDSEIRELALDVVSKMVESWLDPNTLTMDQQCQCRNDIMNNYVEFITKPTTTTVGGGGGGGKSTKQLTTINGAATGSHNNRCSTIEMKKLECKRSNGNSHMTFGLTFEKRPRCNTADETVSKINNNNFHRSSSADDEYRHKPQQQQQNSSSSSFIRDVVPQQYFDLVALHLPIILRLCFTCPFGNVRKNCRRILELIQERSLPIPVPIVFGPSRFISFSELPFLGTCNEKTHTLFVDAFLQSNRLDHVSQVMGYHPSYLEQFLKTQNYILHGDGPLRFDYRHFIAIMAAGRHQCSYLIALQKQEFLLQGGDQNWLRGLKCIPQKLRNLYNINKILAHQPWLLNTSHIEKLTKCGKDSWSLAEVVHAIVILTHFHSLCSFVFSCGVNQELDQAGGYEYPCNNSDQIPSNDVVVVDTNIAVAAVPPASNTAAIPAGTATAAAAAAKTTLQKGGVTDGQGGGGDGGGVGGGCVARRDLSPVRNDDDDWRDNSIICPPSPTEPEVAITTLMQRMKTLSEQTEECTPVELAKRFENIEVQSAELGAVGPGPMETPADISYFIDDASFQYQDFAKRLEKEIHTFRVQDYSWDDHGYSTVNRLYNDVGTLLDLKFRTAYNLTYYTMGGETHVDTSRFRRAIWYYIQALLGIRHDDYDYGEINALVEKSLKTFIKSACCFPERVTKKEYDRVMREFKHSEKVHVNLMVLESRMQAELLYALRTVNSYMTNF